MIDTDATRGVYRWRLTPDIIEYRATGRLTAIALHDPRIDCWAFHPLHWRYLRRGRYVRSQGHARYFRANLRGDVCLFDFVPEDLNDG